MFGLEVSVLSNAIWRDVRVSGHEPEPGARERFAAASAVIRARSLKGRCESTKLPASARSVLDDFGDASVRRANADVPSIGVRVRDARLAVIARGAYEIGCIGLESSRSYGAELVRADAAEPGSRWLERTSGRTAALSLILRAGTARSSWVVLRGGLIENRVPTRDGDAGAATFPRTARFSTRIGPAAETAARARANAPRNVRAAVHWAERGAWRPE